MVAGKRTPDEGLGDGLDNPTDRRLRCAHTHLFLQKAQIRERGDLFVQTWARKCPREGCGSTDILMTTVANDVTRLLGELQCGNEDAVAKLVPLRYKELRRMAAAYLSRERHNHTLQPTAVVHEAYLRLVDQKNVHWQNRQHFFGVAAQVMRRILVDYARGHKADKRGSGVPKISLEEAIAVSKERSAELLALDEALTRLAAVDPQQARLIELRFFGGLTVEETAEVLSISPATVKRDWNVAKAWLRREVRKESSGAGREVGPEASFCARPAARITSCGRRWKSGGAFETRGRHSRRLTIPTL